MTPAIPSLIVFGAGGQVGRSLQAAAAHQGLALAAFDHAAVDIADSAAVDAALERPDLPDHAVVVNAAAYTAVDRAESEPEAAYAVNRDGAGHIAAACARKGRPLIHISTDYAFGGASIDRSWREDDPPGPVNLYGWSKLAGEEAVRVSYPEALILRTAWVYSPFGGNFVKTMLRLAGERPALKVVDDQIGSPTAAWMIAEAIIPLARRLASSRKPSHAGLYHFAGAGAVSRFGFARAIFEEAARYGRPVPALTPIATADMPTPARRAANTALDCARIAADFGISPPPWRDGLGPVIRDLCAADGVPADRPGPA
jgi:dTDP-4-dehydrorhamnose reductase